jgi:hypothetical protein
MGQQFLEITENIKEFIEEQKMFFVATASSDNRINLSPKGMDTLKVLNNKRVIWLNVTGSGNETSAHIQLNGRITIMFTSFTKQPLIVKLYGTGKVVHPNDNKWDELSAFLPTLPGARQIFDIKIDSVISSCGMGTPFYEYKGERDALNKWAEKKGKDGIKDYWKDNNQESIDGIKTNILK